MTNPQSEGMEIKVHISAYAIDVSSFDSIRIERARQIEGEPLWAVRFNGDCLNKDGKWEWEPRPSERDDEFLAQCRFPDAETAINAAINAVRAASQLGGERESQ